MYALASNESAGCWFRAGGEAVVEATPAHLENATLAYPASSVVARLAEVSAVDAVYCHVDHEGIMMVFVVVEEHDGHVYESVLEAEDKIRQAAPEQELEFRIRARQGRPHAQAVPFGSEPVYVR